MDEQLEFDFLTPDYTPNPVPGTFDHRGGDCELHGDNVVFFRPYKSDIPHTCVQCALEVLNERHRS